MKYVRSLTLVLCSLHIFATTGSSQSEVDRLDQAATAYESGNYAAAINIYQALVDQGQTAFELHYNLGNAYYKSQQIPEAILQYEKANKIDPANPDLQHNLALAQSKTVDRIEMIPVPELVSGYKSFVNQTPADRWGTFSLLAFFLGLGALLGFLLVTPRALKQVFFGIGIVLFVATLFFFFLGWQQQNWLKTQKEAIIFEPSITISSTPGTDGSELFVLHAGTKVRILERFKDWVRIRIGDGNTGWLPQHTIKEI